MSGEYRRNHYVPVWYQKRFVIPGAKNRTLNYLDLRPDTFADPRGVIHQRRAVRELGPRQCFFEEDLYTLKFRTLESTEIERFFFGDIDSRGRDAIEFFANFEHCKKGASKAFQDLILYLSTQKLRTPKGLTWLQNQVKLSDRNLVLQCMMHYRQLFCAIWTECVWLIADASKSETKFIISDHPVTVYNRRCGPQRCRRRGDPEIWLNGTHTIFPLCMDKILLLSNLSWVRNPYQDACQPRPNPNPLRSAMFKLLEIQVDRQLSEEEVRQINFIIKNCAHRYVAAGKEEWLTPEAHVSKTDWATFGHGYLLMPDPRSVSFTGELIMGFKDGTSTAFDSYGRRPWDPDYNKEKREGRDEFYSLHKFQGEFARLFGQYRRGRSFDVNGLTPAKDSDYLHNAHLNFGKRL